MSDTLFNLGDEVFFKAGISPPMMVREVFDDPNNGIEYRVVWFNKQLQTCYDRFPEICLTGECPYVTEEDEDDDDSCCDGPCGHCDEDE